MLSPPLIADISVLRSLRFELVPSLSSWWRAVFRMVLSDLSGKVPEIPEPQTRLKSARPDSLFRTH